MKQIYLVMYLEYHGCEIVREDKNGYFIMRNPANGKSSGIPLPTGGDFYKHATVCRVCLAMDIPVPPSTPLEVQELLTQIEEHVRSRTER